MPDLRPVDARAEMPSLAGAADQPRAGAILGLAVHHSAIVNPATGLSTGSCDLHRLKRQKVFNRPLLDHAFDFRQFIASLMEPLAPPRRPIHAAHGGTVSSARLSLHKTWRWLALGAVAVGLGAAALLWANNTLAGGRGASLAPVLANTTWSLVAINGQPPIAGRALTLSFQSESQLAGNSGCNSYGGQYHLSGSSITVTQMISTLRACAEQPLNDQEAVFQKALGDAAQISLAGSQLTLQNASGGEVLAFQKQ